MLFTETFNEDLWAEWLSERETAGKRAALNAFTDFKLAHEAITSALASGNLEALVRTSHYATSRFAASRTKEVEFLDHHLWAKVSHQQDSEAQFAKLKDHTQSCITRGLLYFNLDQYSGMIAQSGTKLWEKVKSTNITFADSTRSAPKRGKDLYDKLRPTFRKLINADTFATLAPELLKQDIIALPLFRGNYLNLDQQLIEFNYKHAKLRNLGGELESYDAFQSAVYLALDNLNISSHFPAIASACVALKHTPLYEDIEKKLLEKAQASSKRIARFEEEQGYKSPDCLPEFTNLANYATLFKTLFKKELPEEIANQILAIAKDAYENLNANSHSKLHRQIGFAANMFKKSRKFLNQSLERDIKEGSDILALCTKVEQYASACKEVLPYHDLLVLRDRGIAYLQELVNQDDFPFEKFRQVYECLETLRVKELLPGLNQGANTRDALTALHDNCVARCRDDLNTSLDLLILKGNSPIDFEALLPKLKGKRIIERVIQIGADRLEYALDPEQKDKYMATFDLEQTKADSAWAAFALTSMLYHCVARYATVHVMCHDRNKEPTDITYCQPVLDDVRNVAENALDFISGVSSNYACSNGTIVPSAASFDNPETCKIFAGLYALVDHLGGSTDNAWNKFKEWQESYKQKFADIKPYEEGFDEFKNSAGLDILEIVKKRKEELAGNTFPEEYRQFNSLMYPSNFIGGEE